MKTCSMCDKQVIGRGLCKNHYYSMRRQGRLNEFKPRHELITLMDRISGKYDISTSGCWIWNGNLNWAGYAMIWLNGKSVRAHREVFKLTKGAIPDGDVICHSCDNPACVNPEHLFSGNRDVNNKDCVSKMRNAFGVKNGHARLSREVIDKIIADTRPQYVIALEFGINQSHVSRIKSFKVRTKG